MTFEQWKNRKKVKEILGDINPDIFASQIVHVLNNRNVSNERIKSLAYWVVYSVEDDFLTRFDKLLAHPINDSSSMDIHILRYGEVEGTSRYNKKNNICAQTEENMISRYGKKEGLEKWEQYKKNLSVANSIEGYIKKYGKEKGTKLFNKQAARNAGNLTLKRKQELFGDEISLEMYNKMKIKQSEKNTLKQYIATYGEEIGTLKYFEKNKVISYKNSLQRYIADYGEEEGTRRIKTIKNNGVYFNNYSKISLELFDHLATYSTLYGDTEVSIKLSKEENTKCGIWSIKPDYIYGKKIIEFNGDAFHANPTLFENNTYPHPFLKEMLASEIRIRDKKRIEVLEKRGYQVKVVWENDFRKDREQIIQDCKYFLVA